MAGIVLPEQQNDLLSQLKQVVLALEPQAEIILYGSRARKEARSDSDWDLLILVDGPVNAIRKSQLRNRLYDIELENDTVISSIIWSRANWEHQFKAMPLRENIFREGVPL